MKLAISALDGDEKTFREMFSKFSESWKTLRYTLTDGISLMLKGIQKNEIEDKRTIPLLDKGNNFSLTLTFLQIVALAHTKGLEVFLELLDHDFTMDDWLEPWLETVQIGTNYKICMTIKN